MDELIPAVKDASCEVVICTPYTDLVTAVAKTKGTNIHVGAENVHFEKSGAFTGEISADMLVDLGVEYVIVGHSERRQYFAETDQTVNKRALAALNAGLKVIICVGESLQQREEASPRSWSGCRPRSPCAMSPPSRWQTSSSPTSHLGHRHRQDRYCRPG